MPALVIDNLPSTLFRAFDKKSYCDSFLDRGEVYFRLIRGFRNIGGVREDTTEGESYSLVRGDVPFARVDNQTLEVLETGSNPGHFHRRSEFMNPTYTLSLSKPGVDVERLRTDFGRYIAKVRNPHALIERIFVNANHANVFANRNLSFCDSFAVMYNKGEESDGSLETGSRIRLNYGQKPRTHQWEDEYRIALVFDGSLSDAAPDLTVSIGSLRDIASLHYA